MEVRITQPAWPKEIPAHAAIGERSNLAIAGIAIAAIDPLGADCKSILDQGQPVIAPHLGSWVIYPATRCGQAVAMHDFRSQGREQLKRLNTLLAQPAIIEDASRFRE
jgi:hypothetical protein